MKDNILKSVLDKYKSRFKVHSVGVFGSYAQNDQNYNDIDILLIVTENVYVIENCVLNGEQLVVDTVDTVDTGHPTIN